MIIRLAHSLALANRITWTVIESTLRGVAVMPPPADDRLLEPPEGETQPERLRHLLWRLRRAYEAATDGGFPEELAAHFQDLFSRGRELKQVVIVWVDFIEVLIQDAERRYGRTPGQGALKARMVKAAVVHVILRNPKFDIPRIPRVLEPSIVDIFADVTIDWVVLLLNRHEAWAEGRPVQSRTSVLWRGVARVLLAPLVGLLNLLERFMLYLVLKKNALSPEVEAAVLKVTQTECPDAHKFLEALLRFISWAGQRREEIKAIFELVALAVEEAETFLEKTGPEKKRYAIDLVLVFLDDLGIVDLRGGLLYHLVEGFLDGAIDSVVYLYNKRGVFRK